MWNEEDPRFGSSGGQIIIVDRRGGRYQVGVGDVFNEEGWGIATTFENYKWIRADDEWPAGFVWSYGPKQFVESDEKH